MRNIKIPIRYIPPSLSSKDKQRQIRMLLKSKKMYSDQHKYYTRKKLASYKSKPSSHIQDAKRIYKVDRIVPGKELSKKTGCSISAMKKIINKGEGAYYSSGSRPNQTPQSWGVARLASALTAGKAAAIDYDIIERGCDHTKPAFLFAQKSKKKYGYGHSKTRKYKV